MTQPNQLPSYNPNGQAPSEFGTPHLGFIGFIGDVGEADPQHPGYKFCIARVLDRAEIFYIGLATGNIFCVVIKTSEMETLIPILQADLDTHFGPSQYTVQDVGFILGSTLVV